MSLCLINSRQVEALCRWDRPSRPRPIKEPVNVIPGRAPAGPALNYDDVPEAGYRGRQHEGYSNHKGRNSARQKKILSCPFQTVVEEIDDTEQWTCSRDDELLPATEQQAQDQWTCAFCTFLNNAQANVCEMCNQNRVPSTIEAHESHVVIVGTTDEASLPASEKTSFVGKKWPSLRQSVQQTAEKSWDFCEQSSLASSMLDVARLADVEAPLEDTAMAFEAVASAQTCPVELYDIFSDTESCIAGEADTSSMVSWCHLNASETPKKDGRDESASVASSWMDVGNLEDFTSHPETPSHLETSPTSSWLKVVQQSGPVTNSASFLQDNAKASGPQAAKSWSSLVSGSGNKEMTKAPSRSGVPVPPLTRCQVPRKKAAALDNEDVDYQDGVDDQDGRGRGRASRQYRRRR